MEWKEFEKRRREQDRLASFFWEKNQMKNGKRKNDDDKNEDEDK